MRRSRCSTLDAAAVLHGGRHARAYDERRRHRQVLRLPAIFGRPIGFRSSSASSTSSRSARRTGQSGTQPLYGVRYSPSQQHVAGGLPGVAPDTAARQCERQARVGDGDRDGFDATFFHSRAQLTFTVYQKRINNVLLQAGVNPSRGYVAEWLNGGEFTNQGAEIGAGGDAGSDLRNGFKWYTGWASTATTASSTRCPVAPFAEWRPQRVDRCPVGRFRSS